MLTVYIYKHTRRTELDKYDKIGDRPWNDPGPRRGKTVSDDVATRPILRAVILDFSAVNFVDVTSVQALIDLRNQFQRYATPSTVEWYFAAVNNPWSKRALVAAGFGAASQSVDGDKEITPANQIVTVAPSQVLTAKSDASGSVSEKKPGDDLEAGVAITPVISSPTIGDDGKLVEQPHEDYNGKLAPVWGLNRPFFFIDVATAVDSAILHAQSR
ncbi:putative sulfate permease 2 protein [Phaeoacremonium minimum UCRPA7]|uniref:Putative sulfate permease 2 protein n=1 Tax=Phaeoacremonium minimum (strain UCR-PA7) TaxID=1286976 RepID=R8BE42_PHAM7|nr:putative sulfate permease 2 protein [Phaeoacremonium minimum UCRPA7]EON97574.1 putative sulfate permease 2 protein [Phaeoacremonium minimum UCRPA7]